MVSVGEEGREFVKTGCPKSAQEIWPCFVRLEGQGASLLAFVGTLVICSGNSLVLPMHAVYG